MPTPTPLEAAFEEICQLDAPLNQRLAAYARKLEELNFPFAEAYDALVARLIEGEIGAEAPKVGNRMPNFVLPSLGGALCSLDDLLADGPVVISLNRGHWCPFCRIELAELARFSDAIAAEGAQIVAILPERQSVLGRLPTTGIKVLSDIDNGYALLLGLVLWVGERLKELMKGRGFQLPEYQGNDGWFVPLPATFVVSSSGVVIARHVDPEFRTRMDVATILSAVKAAKG
ncbi:MAG: peroxiredoxin-like family protein [Parvularculaceae bacterium]